MRAKLETIRARPPTAFRVPLPLLCDRCGALIAVAPAGLPHVAGAVCEACSRARVPWD